VQDLSTLAVLLAVLLTVLAVGHLISRRVRVPAPVILAILGAGVSWIPWLPREPLDPDLILYLFLPPLLYADAFEASWTDFRRWLRPILMLAVGLVLFTTVVVGVVAHEFLPPMPWPVCFILGAILSPTDTVAVQAIIERLHVPRRITAILGGESLVNDATSLLGVQVGVAVLLSGAFQAGTVILQFVWIAGGGVAIGVAAGLLFALINRRVREARVLFVLSLVSPYTAFLVSHQLGTSGLLAVVVAGFVVSWRIHSVPAAARVELYSTWNMLVFVLNSFCFVLIGVEAPRLLLETRIMAGSEVLLAALLVTAAVIVARILWVLPVAYLALFLAPRSRVREGGYPRWQGVVIVSWCGLRGVVSLAAALSLPQFIDGSRFPARDAVLACTVIVILVTLIVQGVTLGPLVGLLGIPVDDDSEAEVLKAREAVLAAGIERLDAYCAEESCPVSVHRWREAMADELATLREADEEERRLARTRVQVSNEVRREVARVEGAALLKLRDRGVINDKTYLDLQLDLDRQTMEALPVRGG
jgi:CPA1 family monovalent cation:H+ antiporter